MSELDLCLIRSRGPSGEVVVRVGLPLVDEYLEFLEGRCRPNTVLAAGYDLRVFFTVVGKAAEEVRAADVLGFITAQRTGRSSTDPLQPVSADDGAAGVSTSTVARRLSTLSGFFAYLQARGNIPANPVPRGLPTRRDRPRVVVIVELPPRCTGGQQRTIHAKQPQVVIGRIVEVADADANFVEPHLAHLNTGRYRHDSKFTMVFKGQGSGIARSIRMRDPLARMVISVEPPPIERGSSPQAVPLRTQHPLGVVVNRPSVWPDR